MSGGGNDMISTSKAIIDGDLLRMYASFLTEVYMFVNLFAILFKKET